MEVADDVRAEIRAEMARNRVSGIALATRLGIGRSTLSKKLNGAGQLGIDEVAAIAEVLGTSATNLLRQAEERREAVRT